jgi:hypothetical protein
MAKRPSYVSIRRRQRNIVEGMGTGNLKYAEAAKKLGVTQGELRRFLETKPRELHKNFNRTATYNKLFEKGSRGNVRQSFDLKRITKYEVREEILRDPVRQGHKNVNVQIGRMLQTYYYQNGFKGIQWSIDTREHDLPNSIKAIRVLFKNGRISKSEYVRAVTKWNQLYKPTAAYLDYYLSELDEEDLEEIEQD